MALDKITTDIIADDAVTSAKIIAGAVGQSEMAVNAITSLENATTTQDLSGTYSTERMYLNDSYRLTGNVTVSGHLSLGSIADEDIVITQDGTERTLTGSGTIDSGNLLQDTHRTSVTGMTGELGSAVTGSPNLNLGNATFPSGHIVQTITSTLDIQSTINTTSTTFVGTPFEISIVPTSASNQMIWWIYLNGFTSHSASVDVILDVQRSIDGGSYTQYAHLMTYAYGHHYGVHYPKPATLMGDDSNISGWSTGTISYRLFMRLNGSAVGQIARGDTTNFMMIQEIKR